MQAEHAVAVSSCTTALHLALVVAGIGPGDDVVVPSFSFIATANAAVYVGARPVFADVDPATGNVTADTVKAALTPATQAVIAVDQGGVPVDLDADPRAVRPARRSSSSRTPPAAPGRRYRGRPVGAGAEIAAWSFHPRKILTTGEGGMLTTSRADWADRARTLREHAMSVGAAERHRSVLPPAEQYLEVGYNFRMTDLQAAVGLVQLEQLDEVVARRRELAAGYQRELADVPGLRCVADPADGEANLPVVLGRGRAGVSRSTARSCSSTSPRQTSRPAAASWRRTASRRTPTRLRHGRLPVTERLTDHTLILPLFHQMTDAEQQPGHRRTGAISLTEAENQ